MALMRRIARGLAEALSTLTNPRFRPVAVPVRSRPRRQGEGGVSLIEALLAAVLFLAIALATVPMFTRSMVSNSSGNDSMRAANFARAREEEMLQLPFNHPDLTIDAGSEKVFEEYYTLDTDLWMDGVIPDGVAADWTRTTRIRQYNVDALADNQLDIAEALPAGTDPSLVHLKEIEVRAAQIGGLFQNETKAITLRTVRSQ